VNGSQLFNASTSVATALGGGAGVDANGGVTAPSYSVGGATVNDVGSAVGNLDGRVTQNSADIAGIQGNLADVAGVASNAVAYDSPDHSKITLGGTTAGAAAVTMSNLAAGDISATSRDAVNGSQLSATNDRVTATESSIANIEQSLGSNSTAAGSNSTASGDNSTEAKSNSTASGDNSTAAGANAAASGSDSTATGGNASASEDSSPGKTVVGAGVANYKGFSAVSAGVTYRSQNGHWLVNGLHR
jgi:trimeric autotransporter adhesin